MRAEREQLLKCSGERPVAAPGDAQEGGDEGLVDGPHDLGGGLIQRRRVQRQLHLLRDGGPWCRNQPVQGGRVWMQFKPVVLTSQRGGG